MREGRALRLRIWSRTRMRVPSHSRRLSSADLSLAFLVPVRRGSGGGDRYLLCLRGDVPEVMIRAGKVRKNPETGRMVLRIR